MEHPGRSLNNIANARSSLFPFSSWLFRTVYHKWTSVNRTFELCASLPFLISQTVFSNLVIPHRERPVSSRTNAPSDFKTVDLVTVVDLSRPISLGNVAGCLLALSETRTDEKRDSLRSLSSNQTAGSGKGPALINLNSFNSPHAAMF